MRLDPTNQWGRTHRCITCPRDANLGEPVQEIEERQEDRRWAFSLLDSADQDLVLQLEADRQLYGHHGLRPLPAPSTKD
ncbi:hypothetical protein [Streptomyces filamentosus]|uniref:hypothetical protein n=1 Tax=Streptomyces filamentosus TaxID=67294 RepID=UPI0033E011B6